MDFESPHPDASVELIARVSSDDGHFTATVDGLDLEGSGSTRDAAELSLIQAVRGWLERQDTAGKLAEALGLDDLNDETEIVLQFIDEASPNAADPAASG